VLQKNSIVMSPVSGTDFHQNTYKDGKISQNTASKVNSALGRFSRLPGASAPPPSATRTYVRGEKMWVTKIECKPDGAYFDLFTDPVADVRYKATLKFEFPKGIALTVDQVDKLIAEVFKVQPADDAAPATGAAQPATAAAPAQRGQPAPAPVQAAPVVEAPPPPIAPPPPPVDEGPPKTVKLGETKDAVVADLASPRLSPRAARPRKSISTRILR